MPTRIAAIRSVVSPSGEAHSSDRCTFKRMRGSRSNRQYSVGTSLGVVSLFVSAAIAIVLLLSTVFGLTSAGDFSTGAPTSTTTSAGAIAFAHAQYVRKRITVRVRQSSRGSVIVGGGGGKPPPPAIPPPLANAPLPPSMLKEMAAERSAREREQELYGPGGLDRRKAVPRPDLDLPRLSCPLTDMGKLLKLVERRPAQFTGGDVVDSKEGNRGGGKDSLMRRAGELRYSPSPYTPEEARDGRHPALFSAGNESLAYSLPTDNVCGFEQLRPYRDAYETYFSGPNAPLRGRTVFVLADSVLRNQIAGLAAVACNPYLMFNCSTRYFHLFNLGNTNNNKSAAVFGRTTDFPNGPVQCYLNGTEASNFVAGGLTTQSAPESAGEGNSPATTQAQAGGEGDAAPYTLPFTFDPKTAPFANRCGERVSIRSIAIEGLTHNRQSFTRAERRQDWHRAFPAPLQEVHFTETNTRFVIVETHCHRLSHIGAFMSNLAKKKREWPPEWNGHVDMVIANGGLHCTKKLLAPFYWGMPEGIETLRQVTGGYDGRPTEFIYYESVRAFSVRDRKHKQVDGNDILRLAYVAHDATKAANGHVFPSRAFTPDEHEPICTYSDPLHPAAPCVSSIAAGMLEGIRYVFAHRSIVPLGANETEAAAAGAAEGDGTAAASSGKEQQQEKKGPQQQGEEDGALVVDEVRGEVDFGDSRKGRRLSRVDAKDRRPIVGDGAVKESRLTFDAIVNVLLVLAAIGFSIVMVFEAGRRASCGGWALPWHRSGDGVGSAMHGSLSAVEAPRAAKKVSAGGRKM